MSSFSNAKAESTASCFEKPKKRRLGDDDDDDDDAVATKKNKADTEKAKLEASGKRRSFPLYNHKKETSSAPHNRFGRFWNVRACTNASRDPPLLAFAHLMSLEICCDSALAVRSLA